MTDTKLAQSKGYAYATRVLTDRFDSLIKSSITPSESIMWTTLRDMCVDYLKMTKNSCLAPPVKVREDPISLARLRAKVR